MRTGEFVFVQAKSGAARHRRRPDHVQVPHALGRQDLRRPGDGAARGAAAARHGDGAVPSDRPARRAAHAHDRHGARGGPARRRRLPAERREASASCRATTRRASARRATSSRARSSPRCRKGSATPARRPLPLDGPPRAGGGRQAVQGHGRALRRLRLRPRRRAGRGRADRALHDGRRRVRARLHHRAAGTVRRGRGHGRRARRQPPRRQRRRQLDGVRRDRRRRDGGVGAERQPLREPDRAAIDAAIESARGRSAAARPATSSRCARGSTT